MWGTVGHHAPSKVLGPGHPIGAAQTLTSELDMDESYPATARTLEAKMPEAFELLFCLPSTTPTPNIEAALQH